MDESVATIKAMFPALSDVIILNKLSENAGDVSMTIEDLLNFGMVDDDENDDSIIDLTDASPPSHTSSQTPTEACDIPLEPSRHDPNHPYTPINGDSVSSTLVDDDDIIDVSTPPETRSTTENTPLMSAGTSTDSPNEEEQKLIQTLQKALDDTYDEIGDQWHCCCSPPPLLPDIDDADDALSLLAKQLVIERSTNNDDAQCTLVSPDNVQTLVNHVKEGLANFLQPLVGAELPPFDEIVQFANDDDELKLSLSAIRIDRVHIKKQAVDVLLSAGSLVKIDVIQMLVEFHEFSWRYMKLEPNTTVKDQGKASAKITGARLMLQVDTNCTPPKLKNTHIVVDQCRIGIERSGGASSDSAGQFLFTMIMQQFHNLIKTQLEQALTHLIRKLFSNTSTTSDLFRI